MADVLTLVAKVRAAKGKGDPDDAFDAHRTAPHLGAS